MSKYMSSLAALELQPPSPCAPHTQALTTLRDERQKRLEEIPFPSKKDEEFRFSAAALASIKGTRFHHASSAAAPQDLSQGPTDLVFWNGRLTNTALHHAITITPLSRALTTNPSILTQLEEKIFAQTPRSPFYDLSTSVLAHAYIITISESIAETITLDFHYSYQDLSQCVQPFLILHTLPHCHIHLVEHHRRPNITGTFANGTLYINAHPHSHITHTAVSHHDADCRSLFHRYCILEASSVYRHGIFHQCSVFSRSELNVLLQGQASEAHLDGAYISDRFCDHHVRVVHVGKNTVSRQHYRGVTYHKGHAVYDGKIIIKRSGELSDAKLLNENLLLHSSARVNAKPQLSSDYDDVKGMHGATVSRIDPQHVWYLTTRGISPAQAQYMLIYGFIYTILNRWPAIERLSADTQALTALEQIQTDSDSKHIAG